jgi:large subunit ribosomal protein L4
MATMSVTKVSTGKASGKVELDDALFGVDPNMAVMHQVVTAQLAARRAGTQSTKTRAEVAGGGAKPWRQKGTGRSRQGSIRSPQWRGGGVALGPKPRSYRQRTPKKMIRLALASALSDRRADGKVVVLDDWGLDAPSTRSAVEILAKVGVEGRVLAVLTRGDEVVWKSLRNLPDVNVITTDQLNAYDVLVSDWVVFTKDSLPHVRTVSDESGEAGRTTGARDRGVERAGAGEASAEAKDDDEQ